MHRLALRIVPIIALVLVLVLPVMHASASNVVFFTFVSSLYSGSMDGTTFPVCYSYDADQVSPVGESYVALNSFDFTLGGTHFSRSDIFQGGQVIFTNGVAHNVTASFQVRMPPGSPVNNITFGFGGDGVIGYVDLSDQSGEGTFDLSSQTPYCYGAPPSPSPYPSVRPSPSPAKNTTVRR